MARQSRRISRKEKARRDAISRSLTRYWKRVRQVQQVQATTLQQARKATARIPPGAFRKFIQQERQIRARRAYLVEEVAFNLKDRDEQAGLQLYRRFSGQETVTVTVTWEYRSEPGAQPERGQRELTFDRGETEEEFWSNYFAAIRGYHNDVLAEQGGAPGKYERFAFFIQRAA